jgi:hypothetical protein
MNHDFWIIPVYSRSFEPNFCEIAALILDDSRPDLDLYLKNKVYGLLPDITGMSRRVVLEVRLQDIETTASWF